MTGSNWRFDPGRALRRAGAGLRAPGRLWALATLAAILAVGAADPGPLHELRLRLFDVQQVLSPVPAGPAAIRVVAIDEASLRRYGQWPWPRSRIAALLERIARGKPRAIGIDILFSEPDRLSPLRIAELPGLPPALAAALARLPSTDALLAAAVAAAPTVLAVAANDADAPPPAGAQQSGAIRVRGGDPRRFLFAYSGLLRSLSEIAAAAAGSGAIDAPPDRDGITRRVPLVVDAAGRLLPALALEVLRIAAACRRRRSSADRAASPASSSARCRCRPIGAAAPCCISAGEERRRSRPPTCSTARSRRRRLPGKSSSSGSPRSAPSMSGRRRSG